MSDLLIKSLLNHITFFSSKKKSASDQMMEGSLELKGDKDKMNIITKREFNNLPIEDLIKLVE